MTNEQRGERPGSETAKTALVEEVASVSTRDIVTGRVRISTSVDHFEETARAVLQSETVEVTRIKIDKPIDRIPSIRTEGEVTIIPVVEEILVVEKRLVLKEELRIRRIVTTEVVEEPVSLRRQRALVERFDEDSESAPRGEGS